MRIKLTLVRPGGDQVNLAVTAEPSTTIGEIARELHDADPTRSVAARSLVGSVSLRVHGHGGVTTPLEPTIPVADSALASGAVVSLSPVGSTPPRGSSAATAARVTILSGPDAGKRIDLPAGSSSIGREAAHRIALADPMVSKAHARLNVTDVVEIIDTGSANGTLVNGEPVDRAFLVAGDVVTLGDTSFSVESVAHASAVDLGGAVHFNRSPRLDPRYPGVTVKAPEPPERQRVQRLPLIALLAPLVMGGVLFALNPGNLLSIVFVALSPLLLVAGWIDNLLQSRKQWRQARREFVENVDAVAATIDRLHNEERDGRTSEAPSVEHAITQASEYGTLMWTRRPEHEAFLDVRLGLGRMPSRHELELPGQRKGPAELWDMVEALATRIAFVDHVPAVENLGRSGSIGVAGPLEGARGVARGFVAQLVTLHSPAEVVVASVASTTSASSWEWLTWLPHVGSPFSPLTVDHLATGGPTAASLVAGLEEVVATREDRTRGNDETVPLPRVVVIVEDDAPVERSRLVGIAERGPAVGVHLLWVAPSIARVPAACRTFVDISAATGASLAGFVHTGYGVEPVACEYLDADRALALSRRLAPVVDAGARAEDASDLPASVSLLSLLGTELARESEAVLSRWQETNSILTGPRASASTSRTRPNLRAVFGQAATEPFALDLRTDGPHALVGGTTGSGKSEFLQAWVLGLATAHSPQRVSFLFVDYKGGAAFADCVSLPHTVGLVTDLSPPLVRRALTSLRAELRYREHLFMAKKVKDIVEFERTGDPEVPPSLIIVVDEFAALVTDVPEFVDGVVDVAQRGRSLGLHLILATQRPAGVIRDNLRANTNLRVALRMADEADSDDVLGTPMAAGFDPSLPGRGAAKTGPGRVRVFQSGYAGGWTSETVEPSRVAIEELRFGARTPWEPVADPEAEERQKRASEGPTDIKRIVETVRAASTLASIPEPRKPWLPPLAHVYDFSRLPNKRTDAELVLGVVDDAASQAQPVVSFDPDRDGNMAVIGAGGSGKSTALRTVAVASAVTKRGGPVHVYGLDFGANGLTMLQALPHVGSIIGGDDEERVARLLRWLRDLVDERSVRYTAAGAGSIVEYRARAKAPDEPRILLLLDGMGAFRDAYEANVVAPWFAVFSQIATDGRQVGVHVVVSGDRAGAIPTSLSSSIQRRLVLRLANADDYGMLGVQSDVLTPTSPPGRGLLDDREIQVAVLGGDPNVAVQARQLEALAESMVKAGVSVAAPIERLATDVALEDVVVGGDAVAIGLADDTLAPVAIDPTGSFVIAGPPGSGRTTALVTVALSLARSRPQTARYLVSPRRSALGRMGAWTAAADTPQAIEKLLAKLGALVDGATPEPGAVALFIENLSDVPGTPYEYELERILKALLKHGQFVVAESETSTWSQVYGLGQPLRAGRKGLLLQPDEGDGDLLLNTPLGRIRRGSLPVGRGFLVAQGRARKIQVATADETASRGDMGSAAHS